MNENTNKKDEVLQKIRNHINPEHDFIFWDQGFFTFPKHLSTEEFCKKLDAFLEENNFGFVGVEIEDEGNAKAI